MGWTKGFPWLSFVLVLSGCTAFQVAGQVQTGRQALVINDSERALGYFQQAAQSSPDYIFESMYFREGVWTYVGRAQYNTGRLQDARQSLQRALSVYKDDSMARLYLGLTLARAGDHSEGVKEIGSGMKGLHDFIEYRERIQPFYSLWDPLREIRSSIENDLAMISGRDIDWQKLISNGEWLGHKMEDEIDRVRLEESRRLRDQEFDRRPGISIGIGF